MSSPVPVVSASQAGLFTESRIGVVVLATPNTMFVNVGGTTFEVGFLGTFTGASIVPPDPGTVVHVIRQDASWVATGPLIGTGLNSVVNPSFEEGPLGAQPVHWISYNITGSSTATVVDIVGAPEGNLAARVFSGSAADHYLYSEPIPVNTGDSWSLSAFVGGDYAGGPATATARIDAMWFANSTDLFPTVSAASTTADTLANVPQYPPFSVLAGNVVVPAATFFMRLALRSTLAAGQALLWDAASARRN